MPRPPASELNVGFVSPRASVAASALISPAARVYGPAVIGDHVVVDANAVVGYPSPREQALLRERLAAGTNPVAAFDEVFDASVEVATTVGAHTFVRSGTVIYSGTQIGKSVDVAHNVHIREDCIVGRATMIVTGAHIMATVEIGRGCRIAGTICNRCQVGDGSSVLGHLMHNYRVAVAGHIEDSPRIGDGVLIGRESAVIGGVHVGDFSIVAAGAVVTQSIPPHTIWGRNPAEQIGARQPDEIDSLTQRIATLKESDQDHASS